MRASSSFAAAASFLSSQSSVQSLLLSTQVQISLALTTGSCTMRTSARAVLFTSAKSVSTVPPLTNVTHASPDTSLLLKMIPREESWPAQRSAADPANHSLESTASSATRRSAQRRMSRKPLSANQPARLSIAMTSRTVQAAQPMVVQVALLAST